MVTPPATGTARGERRHPAARHRGTLPSHHPPTTRQNTSANLAQNKKKLLPEERTPPPPGGAGTKPSQTQPPAPEGAGAALTGQRPGALRRRDGVGGVEASKELGLGSHGPEGAAGGAMGIGGSRFAGCLRGRVPPVVGAVGRLQAAPALAGVFGFALAAPHGPGLEEAKQGRGLLFIIIVIIKLLPRGFASCLPSRKRNKTPQRVSKHQLPRSPALLPLPRGGIAAPPTPPLPPDEAGGEKSHSVRWGDGITAQPPRNTRASPARRKRLLDTGASSSPRATRTGMLRGHGSAQHLSKAHQKNKKKKSCQISWCPSAPTAQRGSL